MTEKNQKMKLLGACKRVCCKNKTRGTIFFLIFLHALLYIYACYLVPGEYYICNVRKLTMTLMNFSEVQTIDTIYNLSNVGQTRVARSALMTLISDEKRRKSQVNCKSCIKGNNWALKKAKRLKYPKYRDNFFVKVTKNCDAYKKLRDYYSKYDVGKKERSFPLAFAILVQRDPGTFERLLRLIYRPHNFYCVHVDLKTRDSIFQAISAIADCFPNVFLASKREIIVKSGFTVLQAHLNCFSDLLRYEWKYLINYAGMELPLQPNNELVKILRLYNGSCILNHVRNITSVQRQRWHYRYKTITNPKTKTGRIIKINNLNDAPPFPIMVTKNYISGAFTHDFVAYLFSNKRAQSFLEWTKSTFAAEEHFFGTLLNGIDNFHLKVPGSDRGMKWDREDVPRDKHWRYIQTRPKCHGTYIHDRCVFGVGDLPYLATAPHVLAEIFSLTDSPVVEDCIEWMVDRRRKRKLLHL